MNTVPKSRDELPRLLSALEDGTLEPAEAARLGELLQTDAAARARYYDHVLLAALLRREGRRAAAQDQGRKEPLRSDSAARPLVAAMSPRRLWLVALAASVLLMLALSVGEATGVTQFVPTIVRVVTGEGSLVIEVDDPAVSVTLDGEDVRITGAGIHELRLRPGTHKFIATKDGQPLHEEVVTIERGGRRIVKVSREANPKSGNTQPVAAVTGGPSGEQFRTLAGHRDAVWNVAFAKDRAVTAGEDHWVRVWDLKTGEEVQRFDGHTGVVYALAISPDGRRALSGSGCHLLTNEEAVTWEVCLWDIENGAEIQRLEGRGPAITSVAFSREGSRALVGEYEGTVRLLDVEQWSEISRFSAPKGLWSVCFSPAGDQALTAGGDGTGVIRLWNLSDGKEAQRYLGHKFGAWHAVFLPDGRSLLSTGQDDTIRHWETDTGKQIGLLRHEGQVTRVAVSADGRFALASAWVSEGRHNLRVFQLDPGKVIQVLPGHTALNAVALSPDGRWGLAGGSDGSVRLWKMPPEVWQNGSPQVASP